MTFGEFTDKVREIYDGNERDYGQFRVMVGVDSTVHDFAEVTFYPGICVLCDATTANAPPISNLSSVGKVFVLEKIEFDRYWHKGTHVSIFASFKAANTAMCDDYRITWEERKCQSDDADGFYTDQQMPNELDDHGDLEFRNGSRIDWDIREVEVEHGEED